MRRLKIIEHISLDGVIQGPGGADEDAYPHGGWTLSYRDPATGRAVLEAHREPFDLLLGRRTYDVWSASWPEASGPLAGGINAATKYVVTHRPDSLRWGPCEPLGPDIVEDVRRVKATDGPNVILWGSSTLTPILLEHRLADDVMLFVYPVVLGDGKRLSNASVPSRLTLVTTSAVATGVLVNTYVPA